MVRLSNISLFLQIIWRCLKARKWIWNEPCLSMGNFSHLWSCCIFSSGMHGFWLSQLAKISNERLNIYAFMRKELTPRWFFLMYKKIPFLIFHKKYCFHSARYHKINGSSFLRLPYMKGRQKTKDQLDFFETIWTKVIAQLKGRKEEVTLENKK